MTEDRIEALRGVPLFSGFSEKDLHHVLEIAKEVSHPDGKMVVEEDASAVGFHLILAGTAEVLVGGKQVGTYGPGDYFGEMSLIDGRPRSASVIARDGLRTLVVAQWNFDALTRDQPEMLHSMLVELCERLRRLQAAAPTH
jgi:CRP/FNR family transcriptional regulator, cyclic AMP receptor protein